MAESTETPQTLLSMIRRHLLDFLIRIEPLSLLEGKDGSVVFGYFCEMAGTICQSAAMQDFDTALHILETSKEVIEYLPSCEERELFDAYFAETYEIIEALSKIRLH
jgi:hypothetical protein